TVMIYGLTNGGADVGVIGESQVVVGAEVEELRTVVDPHDRILRCRNHALLLEESRVVKAGRLVSQAFQDRVWHGDARVVARSIISISSPGWRTRPSPACVGLL